MSPSIPAEFSNAAACASSVVATSVAERVDRHETAMYADAGSCRVAAPMRVPPKLRVLEEVDDRRQKVGRIDTDVRLASPVLPRPNPNLAEHMPVESERVHVIGDLVGPPRATIAGA